MAAPICARFRHLRLTYSKCVRLHKGVSCAQPARAVSDDREKCSSSSNSAFGDDSKVPRVGMSVDGSTLICWHPEVSHPYEHTQPISHGTAEFQLGDGPHSQVLKDQVLNDYVTRYRPDGPNIQELATITYTTKHQWYPKPGKKFRKRNPPKDRDSI